MITFCLQIKFRKYDLIFKDKNVKAFRRVVVGLFLNVKSIKWSMREQYKIATSNMFFCLVSFNIKMSVIGKFYPRNRIAAASYWSQILLLAPRPLQPPPATGNPGTEEKCKQSAAQCKLFEGAMKEGWSRDSFWVFSAHFRTLFCAQLQASFMFPCLIPVLPVWF